MPGYHHEDYHQHFEEHFSTTMPEAGDYATFEPYYMFGYDLALDEAFSDEPYDEVKPELRRRFEQQYPRTDYDAVEEAVRFAYNYTRRSGARFTDGGA